MKPQREEEHDDGVVPVDINGRPAAFVSFLSLWSIGEA